MVRRAVVIDPDGFLSSGTGAPPDAQWVELATPDPIDSGSDRTTFHAQFAPTRRAVFTRPTPGWAIFDGLQVSILGYLATAEDNGPGKPLQFAADDGTPWFTLNAMRMSATWPGAPLRAEFYWHPGERVSSDIKRIRGGATPSDRKRADDALRRLELWSEGRRADGRPTLARGLSEHQRKKADKAIELLNKGYKWPEVTANTEVPESTIERWVKARKIELGE